MPEASIGAGSTRRPGPPDGPHVQRKGQRAAAIANVDVVSYDPAGTRLEVVYMPRHPLPPDVDDLIRDYLAGQSEKALAYQRGVSRSVVRRWLKARGVQPRGRSDAEKVKWSAMGPEARRQQVAAAHDAVRGSKRSEAQLSKSARTLYMRRHVRGRAGSDAGNLRDALLLLGVATDQEYPWGRYNLDLAVPELRVAIEVVSHYPNARYVPTLRERTKQLLGSGWFVVFVDLARGPSRSATRLPDVAQTVVSWVQRARSDESLNGQYLVIGRQGEPTSGFKRYLAHLPRVDHTRHGLHAPLNDG